MRVIKLIFSALAILFGVLGLTNVLIYDISLPLMFVFMGATMLITAKESFDKGKKNDAIFYIAVAIFIYGVTIYNVLSKFV